MSNEEIKRVKNDLTTMRQVLRLDNPYDAADMTYLLLLGLGALVAVLLTTFSPWPQRLTLFLSLSPGVLAYARRFATTRQNQAERPNLWKEYKFSAIFAVGLGLAPAGWILWSQRDFGTSREAFLAGGNFFIGMALLGIGAMDSSRRVCLVMGFFVVIFGMTVLWLEPRNVVPVGAGFIALVTLSTAAYLWWQTICKATSHNESEHSS
jgi:hypothetical protein